MHSPTASEKNLICLILHGVGDAPDVALESGIEPEDFEQPACRTLFMIFKELYRKGFPVNRHTSANALVQFGHKKTILDEFVDTEFSAEALAHDMAQIRDAAFLRKVKRVCGGVVQEVAGTVDDVPAFRDKAQSKLFSIFDSRILNTERTAKQVSDKFFEKFMQPSQMGISTGSVSLDNLTNGWQDNDMIVLAGRPSMGKTAKALNWSLHALQAEMKRKPEDRAQTLVFSLEMSGEQLMQRFVALHGKVGLDAIRVGLADKRAVEKTCREIGEFPLIIDDSSDLTVHELRARARRANRQKRVRMVIVDYLQLLAPTDAKAPREQQVSEMSRGLKALAKELHVPVIVLSQLNRAPVTESRAPRLSDLRESGSIEQDADVVVLLGPDPKAPPLEQGVANYTVMAELAKQRNGPTGIVPFHFEKGYGRFNEMRGVQL